MSIDNLFLIIYKMSEKVYKRYRQKAKTLGVKWKDYKKSFKGILHLQ